MNVFETKKKTSSGSRFEIPKIFHVRKRWETEIIVLKVAINECRTFPKLLESLPPCLPPKFSDIFGGKHQWTLPFSFVDENMVLNPQITFNSTIRLNDIMATQHLSRKPNFVFYKWTTAYELTAARVYSRSQSVTSSTPVSWPLAVLDSPRQEWHQVAYDERWVVLHFTKEPKWINLQCNRRDWKEFSNQNKV